MHCRLPPSGRVASPGSEAKSSQFSPSPSVGGGGRPFWPAVVQKDGGEEGTGGEAEAAGLCVPVSSVCMDLNECVCVCFPFERRI